tara:strand:+ start:6815 stop:7666 length:852 start_codon:yes stop_codon:yes gene_type:complete
MNNLLEKLNVIYNILEKHIKKNSLVITHNAGFFSCCSVRLDKIVNYFNENKYLPNIVDSSKSFELYKTNTNVDITNEYFEDYNNITILKPKLNIDYIENYQFNDYSILDLNNINPLITKYFTPSYSVKEIIKKIENKYNIDYNNICVLFYRGNDKITETSLSSYNDYLEFTQQILAKNANVKFLIQSDETEFINFMKQQFPENHIIFNDEIRHMNKKSSSVDLTLKNNILEFSKNYLAITIIMSKCKYVICGSGNCSIWIMFYRNNSNNIVQYLNGNWINRLL